MEHACADPDDGQNDDDHAAKSERRPGVRMRFGFGRFFFPGILSRILNIVGKKRPGKPQHFDPLSLRDTHALRRLAPGQGRIDFLQAFPARLVIMGKRKHAKSARRGCDFKSSRRAHPQKSGFDLVFQERIIRTIYPNRCLRLSWQ
jgi:hypothetical protein